MIETVEFNGKKYPRFQTVGFASQFAIPFAKHVCKGEGVDVGCNNEEWKFPGAYAVDPAINGYTATDFPYENLDYVFSSHCLEHLVDWVGVLDYWESKLKEGGVIFLYLPHYTQEYWRPWNNRKHINILTPAMIQDYFEAREFTNIFISDKDLYNGFMAMAEKKTKV